MICQLLLALLVATVTVVIHAVGTVRIVMPASGVWSHKRDLPPELPRPLLTVTCLVIGLLVLHLLEMTVWAAVLLGAGAFPDFESALHYSVESFTTVGYGDMVPATDCRLLGPIEAGVGVLMLGWSTAIIVVAVQRIYGGRRDPP